MIDQQGKLIPDQRPIQTGPLNVSQGLQPWLKQATAPITPPAQQPVSDPNIPWYAEQLAQQQAQGVDPEIVKQMLLAKKLERAAAAAERNKPQQKGTGLFGKFGIDPLSRKLGIEPKEFGEAIGTIESGITGYSPS